MKNTKIMHFVQSLVLLPVMAMPGIIPGMHNVETGQAVFIQKSNIEASVLFARNKGDESTALQKVQAEAIDAYFRARNMPLEGTGMKMVLEAEKNDLDWRLIPAISVRESTGGKFECKKADFNAFGWGSCKINFSSDEHAIEIVAKNLGGNNPNTAKHYANKTTIQILRAYNPPSIVPKYAEQVISIMDAIGVKDTIPTATA